MKESKNIITQDLQEIYKFLIKYGFCKDPKPLADAIGRCMSNSTSDYYDYRISNLEIEVLDTIEGSIPNSVLVKKIIFSISIRGTYSNDKYLYNPILQESSKKQYENFEYGFNIEVHGQKKIGDVVSNYFASWHLDKHIEKDGDGNNKFYHPQYHLTFGGSKMEKFRDNCGDALILPTPRIAHPPMDAILGIDFIIQNYVQIDYHKKMTRDPDYKRLLKKSQKRLWRPYYAAISEHWDKSYSIIDKDLDKLKLIPNLQ